MSGSALLLYAIFLVISLGSTSPIGSVSGGKLENYSVAGRDISAWVPTCAAPDRSPLIVSMHAWATNAELQQSVDRLKDYTGKECAVIMYPQGKRRGYLFGFAGFSWNAGGCCPNENDDHVDDVSFLKNAITDGLARFPIHPEMVFAVGISNGGMMANRLACEDPRIKAVVAVSGPLVNGTTDDTESEIFRCPRSVPVLHFHGLEDPIVPFTGCNQSYGGLVCRTMQKFPGVAAFPPVDDYIADWRIRNGVPDGVGNVTFENQTALCTSWGEATSNVTLCTLQNEGHAWPGSCTDISIGPLKCTYDIDASYQAMEFIRQQLPASIDID